MGALKRPINVRESAIFFNMKIPVLSLFF